jgi:hypothetical protein
VGEQPRRADEIAEVERALHERARDPGEPPGTGEQRAVRAQEVAVAPVVRDDPREREPEARVGVARARAERVLPRAPRPRRGRTR